MGTGRIRTAALGLLLAGGALPVASGAREDPPRPEVLRIELQAGPQASHSSAEVVRTPPESGWLVVWARGTQALELRVLDARGEGRASTSSTGPTCAPTLELPVRGGEPLRVVVEGTGGEVELHLSFVAAGVEPFQRELGARLAELTRLVADGERGRAQNGLESLLATLTTDPLPLDDPLNAQLVWGISIQASLLGRHASAASLRERLLVFRGAVLPAEHERLLELRQNLAMNLFQLGRRAEALQHFEAVLRGRTACLDPEAEPVLEARTNLAVALRLAGRRAEALEQDELVLTVRRAQLTGDDPRLVRALFGCADSRLQLLDRRGALELYTELRARLVERADSNPQRSEAERLWARLVGELGDFEQARAALMTELERLTQAVGPSGGLRLEALEELGALLAGAGYAAEGWERFDELLTLRRAAGPPCSAGIVRAVVGLSACAVAHPHGARALLADLMECGAALGPLELSHVHHNLATATLRQGDRELARTHLERALELRDQQLPPAHPDRIHTVLGLAQLEAEDGLFERALERLADTSAIGEREAAPWLADTRCARGRVLVLADRCAEARTELELGIELLARRRPAGDLHLLEQRLALARACLCAGDDAAATELLSAVRANAWEAFPPGHDVRLRILADLALTELARGANGPARRHGIELAEELILHATHQALAAGPRGAEAAGSSLAWFLGVLESLLEPTDEPTSERGEPNFATRVIDVSHALGGLGLAAAERARSAPPDGEWERSGARLEAVAVRLAHAAASGDGARLLSAIEERDALERARIQHALAIHPAPSAPTLRDLAAGLAPGEAWISFSRHLRYTRGDEGLLETDRFSAWVVTCDGPPRRVELGPARELESAVLAWRGSLGLGEFARGIGLVSSPEALLHHERATGGELAARLLAPLIEAVPAANVWYLLPDDALHLVAFGALPRPAAPDGEFLGADVDLRRVTSPRPRGEGAQPASARVVLVGGLEYGPPTSAAVRGGGFRELPGARAEMLALADAARAKNLAVELVSGTEGTVANLRARVRGARLVHLATHGFYAGPSSGLPNTLRGPSPLTAGGLALSNANGGQADSIVSAEELSTWDFSHCELAVLSACESGLGSSAAGQGLASLAKALHLAGARRVLMSLWAVDDEATYEFMLHFYDGLWDVGLEPEQALEKARQALRAAGRPTRDWAAWVLSR